MHHAVTHLVRGGTSRFCGASLPRSVKTQRKLLSEPLWRGGNYDIAQLELTQRCLEPPGQQISRNMTTRVNRKSDLTLAGFMKILGR
jgi:hypothetical protein